MNRIKASPRALLIAALVPQLAGAGAMTLEPLSDGVYAVLQPHEERFDDANSVLIVGENGVVVVDAQARPDNVEAVIALIRELTDAPVTTVINTHWHADHVQGNAAYRRHFGTGVEFIGHRSLLDDVPQRAGADVHERLARLEEIIPEAEAQLALGRDRHGEPLREEDLPAQREAIERARRWVERNRGAEFLTPTRIYDEKLAVENGATPWELHHCTAHTRGDTVVWLPRQRILVTGDLLDDLPYVGHGYPLSWLSCLSDLQRLGARIYVPGHGPVFRNDSKLVAIRSFVDSLIQHVDHSRRLGRSLEQAVESYDASRVRGDLTGGDAEAEKFFDATLAEAIERTWETLATD